MQWCDSDSESHLGRLSYPEPNLRTAVVPRPGSLRQPPICMQLKKSALDGTLCCLSQLQQDAGNARRHEICKCPHEHCLQTESREIRFPRGSQPADTPDLNCNRTEIRKSAECKRGNGERARLQSASYFA